MRVFSAVRVWMGRVSTCQMPFSPVASTDLVAMRHHCGFILI